MAADKKICVHLLRSRSLGLFLGIIADCQIATQKLYYQLDPLSRRSLLTYPPSLDNETNATTDAFILTSARSALARERDLEMRALGGGEGGVLDLGQIRSEGGMLDLRQAIESWTSRTGGRYVGL